MAPGQPDCSSRGSKCSTVAALGTLGTLPRSNNEEGAAVRLDVSHVPPQPCLLRAISTNTSVPPYPNPFGPAGAHEGIVLSSKARVDMHSPVLAILPPIFTSPRPDPLVLLRAIRRPDHRKPESGVGGIHKYTPALSGQVMAHKGCQGRLRRRVDKHVVHMYRQDISPPGCIAFTSAHPLLLPSDS